MKIALFNTKPYDKEYFNKVNSAHGHEITFYEAHLNIDTVNVLQGEDVVCCFINDNLSAPVIEQLKARNIKLIALRSAGFNHVDLHAAQSNGIPVVRVPTYSPYAIAEHTVGLLQALNRKLHRAYNRVREGDFSINNLMGFDLHGKTVGVIGTGNIGTVFLRIMHGFGCKLIAHDLQENPECLELGVEYMPMDNLLEQADIISIHCPLTPLTKHLINPATLAKMKPGITLLNTSRGRILDTKAVIQSLKTGHIGLLGLDVYEEEEALFFEDFSDHIIQDDVLARLLTFPNVLITSHQAFFTKEAVTRIAEVTLENITAFDKNTDLQNQVCFQG